VSDGWKCPGCGACFAPWVDECSHCAPWPVQLSGTVTITWPDNMTFCPHLRLEPETSGGQQCLDCGAWIRPLGFNSWQPS
jgi:hypothetical protein